MSWQSSTRQRGFLLITVVVVLAVLAAMALTLSSRTSLDNALLANQTENDTLDYVVESGMQHAMWRLAQSSACTGYADLPATAFGPHSYSASISPAAGSPVSLQSTGNLASGAQRVLSRDGVPVYDLTLPMAGILTTDAGGKDTFIEGDPGHTDHNKGVDAKLNTSSEVGREYRTLLQFDLSGLPPSATVRTAILELEVDLHGSTDVVEAHRLLRDWTEDGVTWNDYDGVSPWTSPGGDYDSTIAGSFLVDSIGPKTMDITELVRAWANGTQPNYGLLLLSPPAAGGSANKFHSSDQSSNPQPRLTINYVCECGAPCPGIIVGQNVILSTEGDAILGGLSFTDKDLAEYDRATDTATLFFEGAPLGLAQDVDALHVLANGHIVLSAVNTINLGGITAENEDLIDYDPVADTATMLFDGSALFTSGSTDISALHVLGNGNLLLANEYSATLGGLSFQPNDLIEYNPGANTATMLLDGSSVGLSGWIDAVHLLDNGNLVLSTNNTDTLGGLSFDQDDLVEYDLMSDSATLYMDGGLFADSENVRSVHIGPGSGGGDNLLLVVSEDSSLTAQEEARRTLIESWGYIVNVIDVDDSQSAFDTAVAANDVVYISDTTTEAALGSKLTSATIGIVNESIDLNVVLGFSGSSAKSSRNEIDIIDNSHPITTGFALGLTTITNSLQQFTYFFTDTAPGQQVLAETSHLGPQYKTSFVALESGAELWGGGTAAGRRVQLPWGDGSFDINALNADGLTLLRRAIEWGAGQVAGSGTYLDQFNAIAYSGNDGTLDWSNDWQELGESNGPASSRVSVVSSASQCASGGCLRIGGDEVSLTGRGVSREADLDGATSAELTFTIADSGSGASLLLETSNDGGANWTTLQTFTMGAGIPSTPTPQSFDIVSYASANTQIRFIGSGTPDDAVYVYVDNVQIDMNAGSVSLGPVAHWMLDETSGTTAADAIGGHDGTLMNMDPASDWETGMVSGALDFDGSNDYVEVPYDVTLSFPQEMTFSAWANGRSFGSDYQAIVSQDDPGNGQSNYWFGTRQGELVFGFWASGAFRTVQSSGLALQENTWYHLTASFDNATDQVILYVDGSQVVAAPFAYEPTAESANLLIGTSVDGEDWNGLLDDVRIYNRALEATEVSDLFIAGGGGGGGGPACPADFVADTLDSEFSTSVLGISDPWGITYLPSGTTFNGVSAPGDGAWLLVDGSNRNFVMTDSSGASLTSASIPVSEPRGVAYMSSGTWSNHLAIANPADKRIYLLDMDGAAQSWFSTVGITEHPVGMTFIGQSAGGIYDDHIAISSDKDGSGGSNAGIYIVDQNGTFKVAIDLSGFAIEPWGIAHVPGKDSLLVIDKSGTVFIVGFDGVLQNQYSTANFMFGATQPQSIAINTLTGAHAILDKSTNMVKQLSSSTCSGGGGAGSCDGIFRDEFNTKTYSANDGTLTWATDWLEVGESNGPTSGDEQVVRDFSDFQLRTRDNDNGGEGVEREADLGGAASATLTYNYRRKNLDNSSDYTSVEISSNGADGPWVELTRHQGPGSDSAYQQASHNISGFASGSTRIRFKTSSTMGGTDDVFFDNVQIHCTP